MFTKVYCSDLQSINVRFSKREVMKNINKERRDAQQEFWIHVRTFNKDFSSKSEIRGET